MLDKLVALHNNISSTEEVLIYKAYDGRDLARQEKDSGLSSRLPPLFELYPLTSKGCGNVVVMLTTTLFETLSQPKENHTKLCFPNVFEKRYGNFSKRYGNVVAT